MRLFPSYRVVCRMPLYRVISSPTDEPARFDYLHTSLFTLSNSSSVSGLEIAISRELPQSQYCMDLAHRDCGSSCEIAISNPDTELELLSVKREAWR